MQLAKSVLLWKRAFDESEKQGDVAFHDERVDQRVWWASYREKMERIHGKVKFGKMEASAFDTINRLHTVSIENEDIESGCTYWRDESTLCFDPSKIALENIAKEQKRSLIVMHEDNHPAQITIHIHLEDLTWMFISKLMSSAKHIHIVDGIRLWTTIPHKIRSVVIHRPKHMKSFHFILSTVIPWLPSKIKTRICIKD